MTKKSLLVALLPAALLLGALPASAGHDDGRRSQRARVAKNKHDDCKHGKHGRSCRGHDRRGDSCTARGSRHADARYGRAGRYRHVERHDRGNRSYRHGARHRDWGPLDVVHFAIHVVGGKHQRHYDCGCQQRRVNARYGRSSCGQRVVLVPERWIPTRTCAYHR